MNILRWIICVPVGALSGFLALLLWTQLAGFDAKDGSIGDYINALIGGGVSGLLAAYVSALIAPNKRKVLAWALLVLIAVTLLLVLPAILREADYHYLCFTIAQDAGIAAIAIALITERLNLD